MNTQEDHTFPFSKIRGTEIVVGFLVAFFFSVTAGIFLKNSGWLSKADANHLLGNILFIGILASILLQFRGYPALWNYLYQKPKRSDHWNMLLIVLPLIIISLGYEWFWDFMQLQVMPSYLESRWEWMAENPFVNPEGGLFSMLIVFASAVIIAPVVEEILFRGVIFDKISNRWNAKWGLGVSSLIFGFLHMDPIGAFFFGAVLCLVYVQTKSLLLPILCHVLNNFVALLLTYHWPFEFALFNSKEQLYTQAWIGIVLVLSGTLWLGWFIYHRFHYLQHTS